MQEPKIVSRPALTIVGMKYRGKNEHDEIYDMWQAFIPKAAAITHRITRFVAYGAMDNRDQESGEFDYLAGFEVDSPDDMPEGMVCWEIPATRYAVFACTLSTIGQAFNDAYQTWLPQSGYERACGPEFEFYDKDYNPADEHSTMYVYIPIQ
jgi:AraC family transcriptional regulator